MSIDSAASVDGRYRRVGLIGRGGAADVYRAVDTVLDREVALKVLRSGGADESARARFVAEGKILAQLSHPGLVTLMDVVNTEEPALVMELVEGETLHDAGALEPAHVAQVGAQLADALAYAHAHGVVHRDVKPGNVLIDEDGRVRLADFGIARLLEDASRQTAEGLAVGTAAYLAPEQVTGAEVGPPADVYSLGLVLLEALTGVRCYPGTPIEAACARLTTPPEIPDGLPAAWQRILRQMTAMAPGDRPSASGVAESLRVLATDEGPTSLAMPVPEWTRPRSTFATVLRLSGLAAVLVLLTAAALLARPPGERAREVETSFPEVAPSLTVLLEDLHVAASQLGELPGLAIRLDGIDRALEARSYPAADRRLARLVNWLSPRRDRAGPEEIDRVVGAAAALRAALPLPRVTPSPTPDRVADRVRDRDEGSSGEQAKGKDKGKGHGNGKGKH